MLKQIEPKKIYIFINKEFITTPGIYHNEDLGLISLSSDGINWATIADRNLGAVNVNDIGNVFQHGNCYGFPNSGTVTTSSTQVNAQNYGPGNYYSSSTFITQGTRDSSNNQNLWGNVTNTDVARRGPCAEGYHIPSQDNFQALLDIVTALGIDWISAGGGNNLITYLKMPCDGYRQSNGTASTGMVYCYYCTTTPYSGDNIWKVNFNLRKDNYQSKFALGTEAGAAFYIRPFKNVAEVPESNWTVLYQPS